jgi:hypothetical protein
LAENDIYHFQHAISSTILPGDIQRVISEGRLQPVAPHLWQYLIRLLLPVGGLYVVVAEIIPSFLG